ncbi:MAG: hypothetical protein GXO76_07990 [Calditrichaeota bacterium]|nr:hypothetical protein [Calditrichota bacterium]
MKRIQLFFTIFLVFGLTVQTSFSQEAAGQAGEFLRYGVHARALGIGRAYTGLADGAGAIYWNPGGLATLSREGVSATVMLTKLFANTSYNYLGIAVPLEIFISGLSENPALGELRKWNIGAAYLDLSSGNFEERTDANYLTGRTFSDVQRALFLTFGRSFYIFGQQFGAGTSIKFLSQNLFQNKASATALDIGLKYYPEFKWFRLGMMLKNINQPDLKLQSGESNRIPFSARTGIALFPQTGIPWVDAMLLSADVEMVPGTKRTPDWFLGFEYDLTRTSLNIPIKLRAGTNSTTEALTVGLSLNLSQNSYFSQFNDYLPKFDWAYVSNSESALGSSYERFSMDFNWTPLTAQHWYELGIKEFRKKRDTYGAQEFALAVEAKNPKFFGYPISAYLRLGDIELMKTHSIQKGLIQATKYYEKATLVKNSRREIDAELNKISFLNYIQGLILNKEYKKAVHLCNSDNVWVNHHVDKTLPAIVYLKAYSLYKMNKINDAVSLLKRELDFPYSVLVLSQIYIDRGDFSAARDVLSKSIRPVVTPLPDHIYLPYLGDRMVEDDVFLLRAYVDFRLAEKADSLQTMEKRSDIAGEFLSVKKYFPYSRAGSLFTDQNIKQIIDFIKRGKKNVFEDLYGRYRRIIL